MQSFWINLPPENTEAQATRAKQVVQGGRQTLSIHTFQIASLVNKMGELKLIEEIVFPNSFFDPWVLKKWALFPTL